MLIDAGDTFQGGVESDLSEGAVVIDAYNALRYTALAIGNHDFEFGPADRPGARQDPHADPRGALKARAAQARFPFLAANLIDDETGRPVAWPNVSPSVIADVNGTKVGIIGIMTSGALRSTLPVNVHGLRVAPLAETVRAEATRLRAEGATVVIVGAHAGGFCADFSDPEDLSSCDSSAEIFDLARALPHGLVDAIVAGHTHSAIAHVVEGIPIVQSYWGGRAFGRIDLTIDAAARRVIHARRFAPQEICAAQDAAGGCLAERSSAPPSAPVEYEGRPVVEDQRVIAAMAPALTRVRRLQATPLGVVLDTPLARSGDAESALGNLFADALREKSRADVALNNNSFGGLRADLPVGPLTFGSLYDAFPFDNRLARIDTTGQALERGIANALRRGRRGAFGISGARVRVTCGADGPEVRLFRPTGAPIAPDDRLTVAGMDSLMTGQMFAAIGEPGRVQVSADAPVLREVVEDWLRARGGHLRADEFLDNANRRVEMIGTASACLAQ
jgi:5'-nucleotidase